MKLKETTIKMEVNIAGERISLTVPFSRQDAVRNTESELAVLYKEWSVRFPGKTPKELLAMMAYRYASYFLDLKVRHEEELDEVEDLLREAERLCSDKASESEASDEVSGFLSDEFSVF